MSIVKNLIFIDDSLLNFSSIIDNLPDGSQWFEIDGCCDGISQIQNITKNYQNLDSIQFVSHGSQGSLSIGASQLTNSNVSNYQSSLAEIGQSLSPSGDILFYGCQVAADENGQKLIQSIAEYTQADVAASTDLTGPIHLGGDGELEFHSGDVSSPVINVENVNEILMAGIPNTWTDSQIETDLTNTHLEAKMKEYNSDNSYSYLEMRTLLETAAVGGITDSEHQDLKTIYSKIESEFQTDPYSTHSYVKYITYSTIFKSPVNKKWVGGAEKLSEVENLGNMHANMSEDKATKLIKTWFYGENLPHVVTPGVVYKASKGPMFHADTNLTNFSSTPGVLVTADDVNQKGVGSCYFLGSLAAVASHGTGTANAGKLIENMVIDPITDDNIYGIKYYHDGKPVYTTVNNQIPVEKTDIESSDFVGYPLASETAFAGNAEKYEQFSPNAFISSPKYPHPANSPYSGAAVSEAGKIPDSAIAKQSDGKTWSPASWAIISSGDDRNITFTIVGTDENKNTIQETIQGTNNSFAISTKKFLTVKEVTTSGATDGKVKVDYGLPDFYSNHVGGDEWRNGEWKKITDFGFLHGEMWVSLFEKAYAQLSPIFRPEQYDITDLQNFAATKRAERLGNKTAEAVFYESIDGGFHALNDILGNEAPVYI
ncbi:MAG: hypothetical protein CML37_01730, partial [Rhodobacteraceae bacterium]|nr:hypothetical protein [Paracoccaceae bacterium]